ncbi:tetratricopeptide repeat protein [Microbaculum marinisediminis]|uniref:Tetratricopeptide repeat protein n=1 Tax=Microbaculum marinisediminis TaxID=2931392 RepID=A0AAW5R0C4_9HYPH|nr:tetratricopeptide repeat protein [Microbaculum sp. A6E488]MCT8972832.1 tetratricopeptide repeat protein [Microbaculum sp. A6E488]
MKAGPGRIAAPGLVSRCLAGLTRAAACLLALSALTAAGGARAQVPATIEASDTGTYARMIITFDKDVPAFDVTATTGVLVLEFDEPTAPDVARLSDVIGRFITAARRDPDGGAIRLALAQPVTVNTMEAGEKLFVDLMPGDWVGLPPGLPQDVVAELARRAEETEKRQRERELLEKFRNSKPVDVRVSSLPTFTRLVFVFESETDGRIERDVDKANVYFDKAARIDLSGLKPRLPSYISGIESRLGEGGLELSLTVDPVSPVRGFREGNTYVVDVTAPGSADAGAAVLAPRADADVVDLLSGDVPGRRSLAEEHEALAAAFGADAQVTIAGQEAPAEAPDAVADPEPAADPVAEPPATAETVAEPEIAEEPVLAEQPVLADQPRGDVDYVQPEARRFASTVKLTLPFDAPTSAAVFEQAGALWAVFDSPQPIDTRILRKDLSGYASAVDSWRSGNTSVLRLTLAKPLLTTVSGEPATWVITLGDVMLEPGSPLTLLRAVNEDGQPEAIVQFPSAEAVHEIRNPDGSDRLFVTTAMPPSRSIPKPFNFVEFQAPTTIHGLVVRPLVDDLSVRIDGGDVRIGRGNGLVMSEVNGQYAPGRTAGFDASRPGFVDSIDDSSLDPGAAYKLLSKHIRETAVAGDVSRTGSRVQMARALLGTDLGAEALAQLRLIEQEDPAAMREPEIRALRGIAMAMMRRPDEAIREFDTFGLNRSSDVALWRGVAETQRGNWRAAVAAFEQGAPALSSYSARRQKDFRLASAEAALEARDYAEAAVRMAELEENQDSSVPDPHVALLSARLQMALGRTDDAIRVLDKVIGSGDRLLAARAQLRRAEALHNAYGSARSDEIISDLERLALSWRGDEIELGAMRLLANLQVEAFDYYRAFEIMKSATVANSASPTTRALQDDMNRAFQELFLGGRAEEIPAVDALALYYDFRELTPIGRKGDQIIRGLADRMVEVDLLEQAAELLRHQVDNRLKGAERAEVAAKLAWIYLMNRKPADAIVVLSRTRQAVLPREVAYQRLLLESRALAETGRLELALDLLSSAEGVEVDQIRAEALWNGERWQDAGEAFERGLGEAWERVDPLTDGQRTLVLRAAISYALARDQLGLQRLRTKFLAKMAASADAHAFEVVTMPVPENAGEFGKLVSRVAGVDTLDAFLEEYKARYVLPKRGNDKVASAG